MKQETAKSLSITNYYAKSFEVKEVPLESVKEDEVLIQVHYVPFTHYDCAKIEGNTQHKVPFSVNLQASGIIEFSHKKELIGKKVGVITLRFGLCQSRVIVKLAECLIFKDDMDLIKGCMMNSNPFTAYGIIDTVISHESKGLVFTGGNGQLGSMLMKVAEHKGITAIPIVRSKEKQIELQNEGCRNVLNSSADDFEVEMKKMNERFEISVAVDCLAGPIVGKLLKALPKNGIYYNIATCSNEPMSGIDATDMRWGNKQIRPFVITNWKNKMIEKGEMENVKKFVVDNSNTLFDVSPGKIFEVKDYNKAFEDAHNNKTICKTVVSVKDISIMKVEEEKK